MDEPTRQLEVDAGAVAMEAGFEFGPGDPGDPAKLPALDDADRRFGFWLPSQLADAFENGLQNLGYQIISL